ncbi:hypothetical protein SAZ_26760 [Streptomyces noursei ZPM]|nr:hypothetical protein SAZ_26760 [Streptomyces noursei ZPM]
MYAAAPHRGAARAVAPRAPAASRRARRRAALLRQ